MANQQRLGRIPSKHKSLVKGFILDIERSLVCMIVPTEIVDICIVFSVLCLQPLWDVSGMEEHGSKHLMDIFRPTWRNAPLNQSTTSTLWHNISVFEIEIASTAHKSGGSAFFGFFKGDLTDLERQDCLIIERNTDFIYIDGEKVSRNHKPINKLSRCFGVGDSIKMAFDFKKNECEWFVNFQDEAICTKPIDSNIVIPVSAIYGTSDKYEITQFSLA